MSEEVEATEVADTPAPDVAPAESGQAEVEGIENQGPKVLDLSEYGDYVIPLKNGDEETFVPLSELRDNGMRQADYTRKTQELSQASALKAALDANPQETIALLQRTYGVQEANQMVQAAQPEQDDGWDLDDPVAAEVYAMREQLRELTNYRTEQVINETLSGLKAKYGDAFNEQEVIQAAAQRQIQSPAELETVFRDLAFDRMFAVAQAKEQHANETAAEKQAREAAATAAANVISSGNGVAQTSPGPPAAKINSFEDAFNAARQVVGLA